MVTPVTAPGQGRQHLEAQIGRHRQISQRGLRGEIHARPRLIVGISGASGVIYGARLLELLRPLPVETHLVISRTADVTLAVETDLKPAAICAPRGCRPFASDMAAPISSGSFTTIGMIVAPCSMRSMAEIASGVTTTLLSRAADVVLKERRRLVLMVRRPRSIPGICER